MAKFLYNLGSFAARRAWVVIVAWIVVLAALGGAYTAFKGDLTNNISIPGTQAKQVQDDIADKFDLKAGSGTGQVILQTDSGKAATAQEKSEIADAVKKAEDIDGVDSVTDPYAQQQQVEKAEKQLDQARPQIQQGEKQLQQAQSQLDAARKQIPDGAPASATAQLDSQQKELDQKKADFQKQKTQFEQGEAKLKLTSEYKSVSDDGTTALVSVSFKDDINSVSPDTLKQVRDAFSGDAVSGLKPTYDQNLEGVTMPGGSSELIGVVVAIIILFVMLGTFVAAGLPIVMAIVGVAAASLGTFALSGVVDMTSSTLTLGEMLGLAVGIDYSLFILNRHRNNLAQGMGMRESIALATGTSGNAVVFAGTTVIIALLALNVVGLPFLSVMGNVAAFAVFLAVTIAVTLTPAVLGLVKTLVVPKKRRKVLRARHERIAAGAPESNEDRQARAAAQERETRRSGWLKVVLAKPILTVVAVVVALGIIAVPVSTMRLGLPDGSSQPSDSGAYQGYQIMSEKFGEGRNSPMIAEVTLPDGTTAAQASQDQVDLGQQLRDQKDVAAVVPAAISKDHTRLMYQLIPEEGPSAQSTSDLVTSLRNLTLHTDQGDATVGVAGQAAMNIDISEKLLNVLPTYLAIVIGLSFLVLVLVFRSILVPLTATVGFLFSLLAAFGATVAVFQWGWMSSLFGVSTPGPILSFLPIIAVGILFGLAMDYQVFLVSAMREAYSHGRDGRTSVLVGFSASSKVVLTAALIMTGVFLGFVFSGEPMIASIGFVLAAGVLFDAFVIRMTLIPALIHLMGDKAWWFPKWLAWLPNMDVEGSSLERGHGGAEGESAESAEKGAGARETAAVGAVAAGSTAARTADESGNRASDEAAPRDDRGHGSAAGADMVETEPEPMTAQEARAAEAAAAADGPAPVEETAVAERTAADRSGEERSGEGQSGAGSSGGRVAPEDYVPRHAARNRSE